MRNLTLTALIVIGGFMPTAAFAGEVGVTNSYETRNTYNGYSQTNLNIDVSKTYEQVNQLDAIKSESYGGTTNTSVVQYDGSKLTGTAVSTNNVPNDPVAIITTSSQTETVTGSESVTGSTLETYNFSGTENTHTVTSFSN